MSESLGCLTTATVADADHLATEPNTIRRDGIDDDNQESRLDLSCIAASKFDHRSRAIAATSIAAPHRRRASRRCFASASQTIARNCLAAHDAAVLKPHRQHPMTVVIG
ncbi:IclR family transcriptional regulator domain-containing protein [Nocardia sp. CA-119907]|uniref:IclR family transcriptional regulator domain-containing protein n=1 Tax=Nocardia sp. CA-119907 TaxID=3239973 RepID=UPI003D96815F